MPTFKRNFRGDRLDRSESRALKKLLSFVDDMNAPANLIREKSIGHSLIGQDKALTNI